MHHCGGQVTIGVNFLQLRDILDFGSEEQINLVLDSYKKTGRPCFALCFSEPAAGSDNKSMTTVTKKQPDGTYRLSGQKTWVTYGATSPFFLVNAKDEDPSRNNKYLSWWLVPADAEGIKVEPLHKIGNKIAPFCDVFFDDVVLDESMRVGKPGAGFFQMMKNFELERILCCAMLTGWAQAALDDAAAYASERICFEEPIGNFQLIQEKLVDSEIAIVNARNLYRQGLCMMDNGESVRLFSALAKRYASQACWRVGDEALQIMGGLGYTTETRVGRLMLDLRGMRLGAGTDEIMVYIAGRQLIEKYRR